MTEGPPNHSDSRKKVLVVEDNVHLRRALTRLLEVEGYEVQSSETVGAARAMLDGQAALLLDLELPDGTSVSLIRDAKAHRPGVRIAVLSGAPDALIVRAQDAGADVVMSKPIDVPRLLAWLRALV